MKKTVRFRAGVRAYPHPVQGVLLTDGIQGRNLADPFLPPLLPYLQEGGYSEDELALLLQSRQTAAVTWLVLHRLRQGGWLEEVPLPGPRSMQAFWSPVARESPRPQTVSLVILSGVEAGWISDWKARLRGHPWLEPTDQEGEIELVVCCDYRHPALANYAASHPGRLWLPLRLGGPTVWIGPLFGHSGSPELKLMLAPLERNHTLGGWLAGRLSPAEAYESQSWTPTVVALGLQMALVELERTLCCPDFAAQHLLVYDAHQARLTTHAIPAACCLPGAGGASGVVLTDIPKPSPEVDRLLSPEELWPRLRPYLDDRLGAALAIEPIEPTRIPYPCYFAHALLPVGPHCPPGDSARQTQVGRSMRPSHALVGAVCETVERLSGLFHESDPVRVATFEELGEAAIVPNDSMLFSDLQVQRRDRPAQGGAMGTVYAPLDPTRQINWSPVWSLTRQGSRYLPTSLLYYQQGRQFEDPGAEFCLADSNGCACGGCLEEAVFHGLLELIERDAVAIWWYNRLSRPALDLHRFGPAVRSLTYHFEACGEKVWALDLTHDLGVPVVAAISIRAQGSPQPALGFGCHPDPRKAALGALHEAVQWAAFYDRLRRCPDGEWSRFRLDGGQRLQGPDVDALEWIEHHDLSTDPYLAPSDQAPRGPEDLPWQPPCPTFLGEIDRIRHRLEARGLEILVVDQTRPGYPLHVAKVMVPGLRMFWRRLGPGRLYQVPVELGWLPGPLREEELNPASIFL